MKGGVTREPSFDATESETLGMRGNSLHGNRETPKTPTLGRQRGTVGEGQWPYVGMHVCGESDGPIVPKKRANKAGAMRRRRSPWREGGRPRGTTTSARVPDTEPGKRVTGIAGRTTSRIRSERLIVT